MRKRFKNKMLQGVYEHFLTREIDERLRNRGASLYEAFMRGFEGEDMKHRYQRGTATYVAYCAGKERRKGGMHANQT
jgi:hypothetical protein